MISTSREADFLAFFFALGFGDLSVTVVCIDTVPGSVDLFRLLDVGFGVRLVRVEAFFFDGVMTAVERLGS